MQTTLYKNKITNENIRDFIGTDVFITDETNKLPYGKQLHADLKRVGKGKERSYRQLKTWRQALKFIAFHSKEKYLNTENAVKTHVKIAVRAFDDETPFTYYENKKTGERMATPVLKSVSYETMPHLDACGFFDDAFEYMGSLFDMTQEEFVNKVMESVGEI